MTSNGRECRSQEPERHQGYNRWQEDGDPMSSEEFALFAFQIAVMLSCALLFGKLMRRLGQPAVLGEMIGGIILGPTVLGTLAPALYSSLFESSANVAMARTASIKLGMLFFLFIAGLEIDLSNLPRLGRRAILIGLIGTLLPIGTGVGLVYLLPGGFWGPTVQAHFFPFVLFIGMNLANSANPVIARILMDLGLLKEDIGLVIMTATIVDDLINWTLFAIILGSTTPGGEKIAPVPESIGMVLLFAAVVLILGHWLGLRLLQWTRGHITCPTGFIALTAILILLVSSVAEAMGINAFLGAFLLGAALGRYRGDRDEARDAVSHFVMSFFAPLYFVSMGLNANFIASFDLSLILIIIAVACASKIGAVILGEWLAGLPITRETLAIGFGLNVRGATGIILADVGLEHGLIDERIFVALVTMAVVTSLLAAPMIKWLLKKVLPGGAAQS